MRYSIGIIGNGFVGSAIAHGFGLHADIRIYDVDPNRSTHTLSEVINDSEFIFVSVPTPMNSNENGIMDMSIISSVFDEVRNLNARADNVFIIKSTIIPGTIEKPPVKHHPQSRIFNRKECQTRLY